MAKTGEEYLAEALGQYLLDEGVLNENGIVATGTDSPIERLLFLALYVGCSLNVSWFTLVRKEPGDNQEIQIECQKQIGKYRVDFCFTVVSDHGPVSRLIVECDGHDFHERTKEQAAKDRSRDRDLQEQGYVVYRFTGSEIYRGAFGCARQIFRWAENSAWKRG